MKEKINELEKNITIYTGIAWSFVLGAIFPLAYSGYNVFVQKQFWEETELGTFIGGVSGTLAALAGVFFVYVAFLGQRISIIHQQMELVNNQKELQETRKEIEGQKRQMQIQNENLSRQLLENNFYNLLKFYKDGTEENRYLSFKIDFENRLDSLIYNFYQSDFGDLRSTRIEGVELCDYPIENFLEMFKRINQNEKAEIKDGLKLLVSISSVLFHIKFENDLLFETFRYQIPDTDTFLYFYFYFTFFDELHEFEQDRIFEFLLRINPKILVCENHHDWITEKPYFKTPWPIKTPTDKM